MEPPEKQELTKMQAVMVKYLPHNVSSTMKSKYQASQGSKYGDDKAAEEGSGKKIETTPTLRKVNSQNLHPKNDNSSYSSTSNLGRYDGEKSENCQSDQDENYVVERKYARTYEDMQSMQNDGYFKPKSQSSGLANQLGVS